jgi:hypothetical protein
VDIAQAHRLVLVVQGLHDLHREVWSVPLLLGGGSLTLALDDEAPTSVLRKGQHPIMVAVGRGEDVLLLDAATESASYKGKRTRSPNAIDGGAEWEAAVASDGAPLMAAQSRKRQRSLFPMQAAESTRGAGDESGRGRCQVSLRAKRGGHAFATCEQAGKNISGRWEHFFLTRSKSDRFKRPQSVYVGPALTQMEFGSTRSTGSGPLAARVYDIELVRLVGAAEFSIGQL